MKTNARRIVSWIAAMTLLLTCAISGLVLPATAEEENLFVNGDMEQGASVAWGNSALIQSGVGKDGSYGYYHNRTQVDEWTADGQVRYKSALLGKMEANTEYVLSFDYKTSGAARGQLYFDVNFGTTSDEKKLNGGYDLPLDVTNWTTQTIKFTTPAELAASTGWEFSIRARGGAGEVWFDNFVLIKATEAEPPKFEMADPTFSGEHGWTYNSTVDGLFTKGDAVPTQTDTDGNKYITVPANGKYIRSPAVAYDLKKGDWIRIEFKMRKNDAGKATLAMQLQGGMFDGYAQPEWTISSSATGTSGNGEWFTYVTYAQAQKAASSFYVIPFLLTNKTTADLTVDIDDFEITALPEGTTKYDFELLDGSGFDEKASALNDYGFGGLFNDGGKIVDDPADAENNVLYFDGAKGAQAYFYPVNYSYVPDGSTSKKNVRMETNAIYKLTYRQKGAGTTSPGITSSYGSKLSVTGDPDKASDDWKTITVYYQTAASTNPNYGWDFRTSGEVYLDDFSLKLVQPATSVEISKTEAKLTVGETLTLTATAKPDGAMADAIVWTSSDDTVATVADGVVTAVKAGTATITATSGTLTATCTVTVEAAQKDPNLIANGDFEKGATGWTSSADIKEGVGKDGSWGLELAVTSTNTLASKDHWYSGNICADLEVGKTYVISIDYNITKGASTFVQFDVFADAALNQWLTKKTLHTGVTDGWQTWTYEFTVGESLSQVAEAVANGYTFSIRAINYNVASQESMAYVDNVRIEEKVDTPVTPDPDEPDEPDVDPDALVDEKFENGPQGVFAGATDTSTSWNIVDGGVDGGKALAITYKNGDRWFKWNTLTFEPNTRYSITFLAKGPQVRLGVYKYSGSATVKGGSFNLYTQPYQDDWTSYRLEFTTGAEGFGYDPANAGYGMFFNRASALADTTEVTLIDNFKIAKTDETTDRIIGGDFTYPGMQQWRTKHLNNTADGYVIVADPDDATNKVLKVPASTGNLGDNYLQGIYLEAGRLYELSFKAKGAPVGIFMPGKQTSGGTLTGGVWFHTEESAEWKTYTYTFTTTDNAAVGAEANWILNLSRNTDVTGDSYIDDFSIKLTTIPDATDIALNKTETSLGINATETLTFTTTPAGAKYDSVSWKSSDETVATVVDGVVTGKATGTATITVTVMVGDTALTATCTVKVVVKAESFEIVQDSLHLAPSTNLNRLWVYETIDLVTVPADADLSGLTWTSSDENVATVDAKGQVKAINAGTATITVTDGTLTDTITVTVDDMGERITGGDFEGDDWNVPYWTTYIIKEGSGSLVADPTNPDNTVLMIPGEKQAQWMWPAHIDKGVTYKLTMKVMNASGQAIMHITPGHVEGNSDKGWVTRTIATEGWTEVSFIIRPSSVNLNRNYTFGFGTNTEKNAMFVDDVSLVQLPESTGIALEDTSIGVKGSKTLAVVATPEESNVPALTWESSDPSIISVDQSGKITAVAGEGSVTITAKNADGSLTASCTVSIAGDYATEIKLNFDTHYAKKNSTLQLTMSTTPADGLYKKLVWTSSDETIATVDQNGLVTILAKEGETTITLTSGELTATCKVVVPGAAQSFELKGETIKLAPQRGSNKITKTLVVVTTPKNSDAGELTWTSSNEAVATVDANGLVTALTEGETTITVKNADGSITDTCVVTVAWDGERIPGGDFESGDWNVKTWSGIIKDGKGYVVTDPADMDNMVLALPRDNDKLDALWMNNMHVNAGKTYKLSFKVKGDGENAAQLAAYFHPTSCSLNGWKYVSNLTGEWTEVTYIFTAAALDDGTAAALNRNYLFGIDNNKDFIVYLDDFSLVELPEATGIVIGTSDEMTIRPEGSATLNVRTEPAEAGAGKLTWESSDPTIIAVDANGKITVVGAEGSVTITVTNDKGLSDTIKVTIDDYAELLENGDFEMGDTYWAAHATIKPGVGKDGSYGMVLTNTKQDYFYKGVLPLQPATTYIVEWDYKAAPESGFRLWGGKIGVSLYANTKSPGEWKHDSDVFTTPSNMQEINSADLKGWIFSVVSDTAGVGDLAVVDNISIKLYASGVEAESIKLNKQTMTMMPGRTENLAIMATPVDGDVNRSKWYSSDENVATVEYGIVTAVGKGTATITAETLGGLKATCTVTVAGEPAFITNGTFEDAEDDAWILGGGASITEKTGVQNTHSGTLTTAETDVLSQKVTGLKPETTYQLFVRYRGAAAGKMAISLVNGEELALFEKSVDVTTSWTKETYEFTTPAEIDEESILSFVKTSGSGALYIDHVFLSQKASMIDLVVENLIWDGGNEQVKPGTELTFFVMIKNQGDDPVKAGSVIDTDICMDGKPIQTISYLVTADMTTGTSVLVAGAAPWAAVEGDHVISARVNSTMSVLEFDPTNNNRFQTDLRVNDVILEVPDIAANAGFDTLGFSDDFNNIGLIDSGDTRTDGYKWYVSRPYGASSVTADGYFIEDGILTLVDKVPTYNMSLTTAEYKSGIGFSYNQGYMEVRFRIPRPRANQAGEDGIPAIWSLPIDKLQGHEDVNWCEMDWLEYWGINGLGANRPDGYYTITLHDQDAVNSPNPYYNKNSNASKSGLGDGEWHTMAWLWVQNAVVAYLDGEEVFRLKYDPEDFSDPMASVVSPGDKGGLGAFSYMNEQWLPVHISGSADNPMEMDYIRIWTSTGGGSIDIPSEDEEVVIDMAAEDFWYNYCTDDWGDPIVEANEDNYHNILGLNFETGEYDGVYVWEHLTDDRRAEINALLESLGQPSYDELLADALIIAEGGEPGGDGEDGTSPDTGEHTAVPAMAAIAVLSAAALWISRKRKKAKA